MRAATLALLRERPKLIGACFGAIGKDVKDRPYTDADLDAPMLKLHGVFDEIIGVDLGVSD